VVFVDAHVEGTAWSPVHWQEITPAYDPGFVTHHLKPQTLLALCLSLYAKRPQGYILSVLGTDFDFGEELSSTTSARAEEAVERLEQFWRALRGEER
jgi:hydrogenase maturation protease